jgi:hypothetical protein
MVGMNSEQYEIILNALRIDRAEVFFPADSQLPVSEPQDAMIPQIGFIGNDYRTGGDILLGINPGGGGDAYRRTAKDSLVLPMIAALRTEEASLEAAKATFGQYAANMRTWNLWRIVEPVLDACGRSQSEVVYLNWCPFRTRGDAMPHAPAMRRCFETYLAPIIAKLAPGRVIALGKKVGNWAVKVPFGDVPRFVVPRTIGDSYLSAEARETLTIIRQASS